MDKLYIQTSPIRNGIDEKNINHFSLIPLLYHGSIKSQNKTKNSPAGDDNFREFSHDRYHFSQLNPYSSYRCGLRIIARVLPVVFVVAD